MINIRITLSGVEGLRELISDTRAEVGYELVDLVTRSAATVANRAAEYPPQAPNAKYRRTGTLGRRWGSRVVSTAFFGSLRGVVFNPTSYAPDVMGPPGVQKPPHIGRWLNSEQLVETVAPRIRVWLEQARINIESSVGDNR